MSALGLGKSDHVTDEMHAGHQHYQAIQAKGQAAVRGSADTAGPEAGSQTSRPPPRHYLQDPKHGFLHVALVNTNAATAELTAIQTMS